MDSLAPVVVDVLVMAQDLKFPEKDTCREVKSEVTVRGKNERFHVARAQSYVNLTSTIYKLEFHGD